MRRLFRLTAAVASGTVLVLAAARAAAGGTSPASTPDPLAAEIDRWSSFVAKHPDGGELWGQVKSAVQPLLDRAGEALRDGRRNLALHRLAAARANLAATVYLEKTPAARRGDMAAFEAEWTRMGRALSADIATPRATALADIRPAAVRAIGEAALPQVRAFYQASLEYGRNTMAETGFFYLGSAEAQKSLAAFCRRLSAPTPLRPPALRSLAREIDGLQAELLAAYHPPASLDRHSEFIGANATVNEARELDAAGLRYGALLRYLQACQRIALLRSAPPSAGPGGALGGRLDEYDRRLAAGGVDHSLGRIFLEAAQSDLAHPAAVTVPLAAAAIASDVLPRYFAALEPAPPPAPRPDPRVTVTLVRWPYT